jgi:integrase
MAQDAHAGEERAESLIPYLEAFWEDSGSYATGKRMHEESLSLQYLYNNRLNVSKHIKPYFETLPKVLTIDTVKAGHIEDLKEDLSEDGEIGNRTINSVLQTISVALGEAERLGLIRGNPCKTVRRLSEKKYRRQPLSLAEVKEFFGLDWLDPRLKAINLLAATTGMRLGECRGLLLEDIQGDHIHVCHNWQDREGIKPPKWNEIRDVPLPAKTKKALDAVAKANPWKDGFVFFGAVKRRPIDKKAVEETYASAVEVIGIANEDRKTRGLDFHAWRDFFNSALRGRIDDHSLRELTGHKSEEMTERYTEITAEQRVAIKLLADSLV